MAITRHDTNQRMSQAVETDTTVHLAGLVASEPVADPKAQAEQILAKVDDYLARCGSDKSNILSAQIWLANMAYFSAVNEIWDAWIDPANPPARACVESKLASPQYMVEIMITAAK